MTQETSNFIGRHITSLRDLSGPLRGTSPGLAEMLDKSARIIEQVVDGNAALRAEHERQLTSLREQVGALEAQLTAVHQRIAALTPAGSVPIQWDPVAVKWVQATVDPAWHALPCSPHDLNALAQLMPGGWAEIEWQAEYSTFVVVTAWGITPAVFEDYEWQDIHPDPGPGMHHKRPEDCFDKWPQGRRCFAEYVQCEGDEGDSGFRLLAVDDDLVYSDPVGTPEPATFEMCQDCDANLGSGHIADDHCPICHKDGTLLLMREDGVRVP